MKHTDYAARAVLADIRAELEPSPEGADGWRKLADQCREMAFQEARDQQPSHKRDDIY